VNEKSGKILVSGVSGTIGAALLPALREQGHQITRLVRGPKSGGDQITWDPGQPLRPQSVAGFDAVIHLAGESVVGRWTEGKKQRILNSRVQGTRHLAEALADASQRPHVLVTASAIGYYGDRGEEVLTEDSTPGKGFLPEVCRAWEAAALPAEEAGIRTAQVRIGLVLSPAGGALQKMLTPFRLGIGGNMGNGRQWWSWIDARDMVGAILHIVNGDLGGPVNLVAPAPVRNAEFASTLASVLRRPAIFPMPAFAARLAFGQMADELLLSSQKVEPAKLMASRFPFRHRDLKQALGDILQR
jgi:uncharacterized protein (TIGR01777 family)